MSRYDRYVLPIALIVLLTTGCTTVWHASFFKPEDAHKMSRRARFLKAHTASGDVFVLAPWKIDVKEDVVAGVGILYDRHRKRVLTGALRVALSEVALLEVTTPVRRVRGELIGMAILTVVTSFLTVVCLIDGDACGL